MTLHLMKVLRQRVADANADLRYTFAPDLGISMTPCTLPSR